MSENLQVNVNKLLDTVETKAVLTVSPKWLAAATYEIVLLDLCAEKSLFDFFELGACLTSQL